MKTQRGCRQERKKLSEQGEGPRTWKEAHRWLVAGHMSGVEEGTALFAMPACQRVARKYQAHPIRHGIPSLHKWEHSYRNQTGIALGHGGWEVGWFSVTWYRKQKFSKSSRLPWVSPALVPS